MQLGRGAKRPAPIVQRGALVATAGPDPPAHQTCVGLWARARGFVCRPFGPPPASPLGAPSIYLIPKGPGALRPPASAPLHHGLCVPKMPILAWISTIVGAVYIARDAKLSLVLPKRPGFSGGQRSRQVCNARRRGFPLRREAVLFVGSPGQATQIAVLGPFRHLGSSMRGGARLWQPASPLSTMPVKSPFCKTLAGRFH